MGGRTVRLAVFALGGLVLAAAAGADPTAERQSTLIHRLKHDCGSCHGMTMKGGLGPALLPSALANRSDDVLATIITDGVPGTPMPPWDFELSQEEAVWLVRRMKRGVDNAN